eukprot:TRINITY_DN6666_c0_g1_i2.p1 TRINITY_DN6666_c0_g1~~TRINITY_DN6666_c0_g1_i2.p1  ORF type:complete len:961 (+),score=109.92 TRINITY_DN6666_c0_g1_i2:91-2883(+)
MASSRASPLLSRKSPRGGEVGGVEQRAFSVNRRGERSMIPVWQGQASSAAAPSTRPAVLLKAKEVRWVTGRSESPNLSNKSGERCPEGQIVGTSAEPSPCASTVPSGPPTPKCGTRKVASKETCKIGFKATSHLPNKSTERGSEGQTAVIPAEPSPCASTVPSCQPWPKCRPRGVASKESCRSPASRTRDILASSPVRSGSGVERRDVAVGISSRTSPSRARAGLTNPPNLPRHDRRQKKFLTWPPANTQSPCGVTRHHPNSSHLPVAKGDGNVAVQSIAKAADLHEVSLLLHDSDRLSSIARHVFRLHDVDGDNLLSLEEFEVVLPMLHAWLQMKAASTRTSEDARRLARRHMRRFSVHGGGALCESAFVELFRWTVWRRFEELHPVCWDRAALVGTVHTEMPDIFYELGQRVGSGNFGSVRHITHKASGSKRVMKTMCCHDACGSDVAPIDTIKLEITILAQLDHPHILRMHESFHAKDSVHIVTDVCAGGDLFGIMRENAVREKVLGEPLVVRIFSQVLQAVAHCHDRGVIHKDIKFENLMLRQHVTCASSPDEIHVVVIDFGLAEVFSDHHGRDCRSSTACGTLVTIAPEVIAHNFSFKCDIWSVGCLIFAMLNSSPRRSPGHNGDVSVDHFPFPVSPTHEDPMGLYGLLKSHRCGPDWRQVSGASEDAVSAMKKLLCFEEEIRPGASTCLQLPWFREGSDRSCPRLSQTQLQILLERSKCEVSAYWELLIAKAASQLPLSKVTGFVEQFKTLDVNGNGYIRRSELVESLLNQRVQLQDAERIAEAADLDKTGRISWLEFIALLLPTSEDLLKEGLTTLFGHGKVCVEELEEALRSGQFGVACGNSCLNNPSLSRGVAEMMLKDVDRDCGGTVSIENLSKYLLGRHSGDSIVGHCVPGPTRNANSKLTRCATAGPRLLSLTRRRLL